MNGMVAIIGLEHGEERSKRQKDANNDVSDNDRAVERQTQVKTRERRYQPAESKSGTKASSIVSQRWPGTACLILLPLPHLHGSLAVRTLT